jgi:small-conductance mechanosensitive channel
MIQNWSDVIRGSFYDIWRGFVDFAPRLIFSVVIFIVGWFVANLLSKVIAQIIKSIKVDHALRSVQADLLLKKAGFELDSGAFIGGLVKWFVIVVFLVGSFGVLGLNQVTNFLQQVVLFYLPQVIVASFMILVAAVIAEAVQRVVSGAAVASGIKSANFAGSIARWAIWIFGILVALSQLGVAAPLIQTLFTGVVVAISIALGLSFGLGGQQAASQFIEKVRQEISDRSHHS